MKIAVVLLAVVVVAGVVDCVPDFNSRLRALKQKLETTKRRGGSTGEGRRGDGEDCEGCAKEGGSFFCC